MPSAELLEAAVQVVSGVVPMVYSDQFVVYSLLRIVQAMEVVPVCSL